MITSCDELVRFSLCFVSSENHFVIQNSNWIQIKRKYRIIAKARRTLERAGFGRKRKLGFLCTLDLSWIYYTPQPTIQTMKNTLHCAWPCTIATNIDGTVNTINIVLVFVLQIEWVNAWVDALHSRENGKFLVIGLWLSRFHQDLYKFSKKVFFQCIHVSIWCVVVYNRVKHTCFWARAHTHTYTIIMTEQHHDLISNWSG